MAYLGFCSACPFYSNRSNNSGSICRIIIKYSVWQAAAGAGRQAGGGVLPAPRAGARHDRAGRERRGPRLGHRVQE